MTFYLSPFYISSRDGQWKTTFSTFPYLRVTDSSISVRSAVSYKFVDSAHFVISSINEKYIFPYSQNFIYKKNITIFSISSLYLYGRTKISYSSPRKISNTVIDGKNIGNFLSGDSVTFSVRGNIQGYTTTMIFHRENNPNTKIYMHSYENALVFFVPWFSEYGKVIYEMYVLFKRTNNNEDDKEDEYCCLCKCI